MPELTDLSYVRALCEKYDFALSKGFGQNFIINPGLPLKIVDASGVDRRYGVIEIGPGPGALTRAIEAQPHARLVLLEKDSHWAAERQRLGAARTQAVLTDALRFDWSRITPDNPWKIIGNLPYNVASPMMWDLFSRATGLVRAAFMVQKEVGQRLAAGPGNGHYGALSVWVQSFARPRMEFIVGPGAFSPPPKVDSAVLSFEPLPLDQRPERPDLLALVIKVCFQQRRKQLGSIARRCPLAPWLSAAIEQAGITPTLRPEQLTVADFQHISRFGASLLDNPLKN